MRSNGIPPPLPPEAKNFLKSTFKFCKLYYKNLTINAVKWHSSPPPLVAPSLAARDEILFENQPLNYAVQIIKL